MPEVDFYPHTNTRYRYAASLQIELNVTYQCNALGTSGNE